jgi:preprotein translocase subunit SecD
MKTLAEILRDADPLGCEPGRTAEQRRRDRQRILTSAHLAQKPPRRIAMMAVAAVALVAIATGYWSVTAAVRFEVRLAEENPASGLRPIVVSATRTIYLQQRAVATNSDVAGAELIPGSAGTFNISITFTEDGAAKMRRATEGHIGRPVAILIDGDVVMAPVVKSPISRSAVITGNYTKAEAERIVSGIVGR